MVPLTKVEGIGAKYAERLAAAGVRSTAALLEAGKTPRGRKDLAARTRLSEALILKWVNRVDLIRVKGVGEEYADLLEASGVDTVPELAQRNAANLYQTMKQMNDSKHLVRRLPAESQVRDWIARAKKVGRVVTY